MRDLLVKQRTMLINAIRGHAAEFGVTAAKGPKRAAGAPATDERAPVLAREMIGMLASHAVAPVCALPVRIRHA